MSMTSATIMSHIGPTVSKILTCDEIHELQQRHERLSQVVAGDTDAKVMQALGELIDFRFVASWKRYAACVVAEAVGSMEGGGI